MIEITDKQLCCGCSACVSVCPKNCISFAEDEEGFLYPKVDKTNCINCNLCENVCQFVRSSDKHIPKKVYAAKNLNEQERLNSSSGGIFILLAREFISKGGVVFGVKFDENFDAIHTYAESFDELKAFQGSKYVQSRIGNTYLKVRDFLKEGRRVLFSGTGCQILGLKKFLQKNYDNLFTVEIVCHGVPSPKIWKDYLNGLGLVDINEFSFRNKSNGWKNFYLEAKNNKNTIIFRDSFKTNIYMKGFLNNLFLRPSCFNCVARQKSGSDIILGDFWGISNFLPEFDDDKGVSLVLINSSNAEEIYNSLQVESVETEYPYALKGNPVLEISVKKTKKREKFWIKYKKKSLIPTIDNLTRRNCFTTLIYYIKKIIKRFLNYREMSNLKKEKSILIVSPNLNDFLTTKVKNGFESTGRRFKVDVCGFIRNDKEISPHFIVLGKTISRQYITRPFVYLCAFIRAVRIFRNYDIIYSWSIDCVLFAYIVKAMTFYKKIKFIYAYFDVHHICTRQSFVSKIIRGFERFIAKNADMCVFSSPLFLDEYFNKLNKLSIDNYKIIENKIAQNYAKKLVSTNRQERILSDNIIFGYVGILSYVKTFKFMSLLAENGFDIYFHGKYALPESISKETLETKIKYCGPYKNPIDFERIFSTFDISFILIDFCPNTNTQWQMTNRFYDALLMKKPVVIQKYTAHEDFVLKYDIGVSIDIRHIDEAIETLRGIKKEDVIRWKENISKLPESEYLLDKDVYADLVDSLFV